MKEGCRNFEESIQRLIDDDLSEEERLALLGHLDECTACSAEMAAYSILFSGLESMPLDEPSAGFNASVLNGISFPSREAVSTGRTFWALRPSAALGLSVAVLSLLGFFQVIVGAGKISYIVTNGLIKAVGVMEWLGMSSVQGIIEPVKFAADSPALRSLLLVGRILLNAASTTISDPLFGLMVSMLMLVGVVSSVMMRKLMGSSLSRISVDGTFSL